MRVFATKPSHSQKQAPLLQARPAHAPRVVPSSVETRFAHDFSRLPVQAKLTIHSPADSYEREADRVAEQVMRTADEPHRGPCACGGECPECKAKKRLQTKRLQESEAGDVAPPSVHEALRSFGQPLDPATGGFFSSRFGHDFSHVRVHTGEAAARSAREIDALAYTVGRDVVFAPGQYQPDSDSGRRLLAHELTHVLQQGAASGPREDVQRKEKPKAPTAADAPHMKWTAKDSPCACLVVVHNNERDARDTAELMHRHCSYNLALVDSASTDRHIKIPPSGTKKDPNELFPRDVAEKCMKDDKACRDHLTSKSGATKESEILEYLKIQYFLTIKDCSAGFTLPVVAIHNNAINDTAKYLKEKKTLEAAAAKKGDPNPMDVFKEVDKPEGKHKKSDVEKLLKKKFQEQTVTDLVGTPGATNIYRWCKSKDLSRCHIGDPDHPDDVVWVTKPADFERLSKTNVNVALQTDLANAKGGESEKDLSTLFLVIEDILGAPHREKAGKVTKEMVTDIAEAWDLITGLLIAAFSAAITSEKAWEDFLKAMAKLSGLSSKLDQLLKILSQAADELDKVRYINIETPHVTALNRPMSERVRNYETIVTVLSALGLHCCGKDEKETKKAEGDIKAKLNPPPAQSEKDSPSTK